MVDLESPLQVQRAHCMNQHRWCRLIGGAVVLLGVCSAPHYHYFTDLELWQGFDIGYIPWWTKLPLPYVGKVVALFNLEPLEDGPRALDTVEFVANSSAFNTILESEGNNGTVIYLQDDRFVLWQRDHLMGSFLHQEWHHSSGSNSNVSKTLVAFDLGGVYEMPLLFQGFDVSFFPWWTNLPLPYGDKATALFNPEPLEDVPSALDTVDFVANSLEANTTLEFDGYRKTVFYLRDDRFALTQPVDLVMETNGFNDGALAPVMATPQTKVRQQWNLSILIIGLAFNFCQVMIQAMEMSMVLLLAIFLQASKLPWWWAAILVALALATLRHYRGKVRRILVCFSCL